jgi:hemerythrin-like metal-binding protein
MTALAWTDALALHQPCMDDTHREFVDALNAVDAARGRGLAAALQALQGLIDHSEAHFGQEDRWMAELGFEPGTCHPAQHRQILEVLHEVQRRLQRDGEGAIGLVDAMVPALAEWFPMHAQSMDAGLVLLMAERGYEPVAG